MRFIGFRNNATGPPPEEYNYNRQSLPGDKSFSSASRILTRSMDASTSMALAVILWPSVCCFCQPAKGRRSWYPMLISADFTAGHQEKWAVSQCPERSHVAAVLGCSPWCTCNL